MSSKLKEPLFLAAPFFMVRAPILPIEDFHQLLEQDHPKHYLFSLFAKDAKIREALLIASPNLHQALQGMHEKDQKQQDQMYSSLLKYFLRMTSRSTPFGLFSFVALGSWNHSAQGEIDLHQLKKHARPDMEWLMKAIDLICEDPNYFEVLRVRKNPLVTCSGGRLCLNYLRRKNNEEQEKKVSIRMNILTSTILKLAEKPISLGELEKLIGEEIPSIDREKMRQVIKQLLSEQILIFDLLPNLLTGSPYKDFIEKFSCFKGNANELEKFHRILKSLEEYMSAKGDQSESVFRQLHDQMREVVDAPHYLQVDLSYRAQTLTLPPQIGEEFGEAAEFLWNLSQLNESNQLVDLSDYHSKFLEKYGEARRIPLLELLDEHHLGIPEIYANPSMKSSKQVPENAWQAWIKAQWCACLYEKRGEIVLNENTIADLTEKETDKKNAFLSFDLFCEVLAESAEKIGKGEYTLYLASNTWQAGNSFGRFLDAFGPHALQNMRELFSAEEQLDPSCQFVEASYLPQSARSCNVAIHPSLRQIHLDLGKPCDQNGIDIKDIYVGANAERFYFTNLQGDQELIFNSGNVLTTQRSPVSIRFLRDASSSRYKIMGTAIWGDLQQASFLPRIKYKKVILSLAQWNLSLLLIGAQKKEGLASVEEKLKIWMEQWNLPRFVFMTEGDNRILLDRNHPDHIREMVGKLVKGEKIKLVEKYGEGGWLKSQQGSHLSEIVIPFVKNPHYHSSRQSQKFPKFIDLPQKTRWKLPGGDWLYVKFFLPKEQQERFLVNLMNPFAQHLLQQQIIDQWFYIRYQDQGPHIRVRFHGEPDKILTTLVPMLHEWSHFLFQEKAIQNIQWSGYEREIERYGGENLIEAVESFFCGDTRTAVDLLSILAHKKTRLPNYVVVAISLIDLLKGFGLSFENEVDLMRFGDMNREELKGVREWRAPLGNYAKQIFNPQELIGQTEESNLLVQAFEKRRVSLTELMQLMKTHHERDSLDSGLLSIQNSLIHMHCNRVMGTDPNLEKKARLYMNYAMHLVNASSG